MINNLIQNFEDLEKKHRKYVEQHENMDKFKRYNIRDHWKFKNLNEKIVEETMLEFLNKWGKCFVSQ